MSSPWWSFFFLISLLLINDNLDVVVVFPGSFHIDIFNWDKINKKYEKRIKVNFTPEYDITDDEDESHCHNSKVIKKGKIINKCKPLHLSKNHIQINNKYLFIICDQ